MIGVSVRICLRGSDPALEDMTIVGYLDFLQADMLFLSDVIASVSREHFPGKEVMGQRM